MSSRRPRVKPVANLAPRKPKGDISVESNLNVIETVSHQIEDTTIKSVAVNKIENDKVLSKADEICSIVDETEKTTEIKPISQESRRRIKPTVNISGAAKKSRLGKNIEDIKNISLRFDKEDSEKSFIVNKREDPSSNNEKHTDISIHTEVEPTLNNSNVSVANSINDEESKVRNVPKRHKIKPKVVIPTDRKTVNIVKSSEGKYLETDQIAIENITANNEKNVISSTVPECMTTENTILIAEKPPPTPESIDDSVFKSPQYYPNIRSVPSYNRIQSNVETIPPNHTDNNNIYKDDLKCPLSPTKVRQRIKPTPFFGNRRNSIQGREDNEELPRRQRNLSTSSNHSTQSYNISKSINSPYNRIRTESACSNASDISMVREIMTSGQPAKKVRTSHKNEETNRMSDAKREFRSKFGLDVPDKTQLTMFDMIYYNPVTNPMKNPAIKEEKDRRSNSGSSITSINTKRKIPTPLPLEKREETETAMPVPQLKIGPDGEIVIDEKSLVIETTDQKEAKKNLLNADIVYDDEFSGSMYLLLSFLIQDYFITYLIHIL